MRLWQYLVQSALVVMSLRLRMMTMNSELCQIQGLSSEARSGSPSPLHKGAACSWVLSFLQPFLCWSPWFAGSMCRRAEILHHYLDSFVAPPSHMCLLKYHCSSTPPHSLVSSLSLQPVRRSSLLNSESVLDKTLVYSCLDLRSLRSCLHQIINS